MAEEHWFDRLHRTLTDEAPRRGLLRSIGAFTLGFLTGETSSPGAAKPKKNHGKKNGKKNQRHKGKNKPKRKPQKGYCKGNHQPLKSAGKCSGGACAAQWPTNEKECEWCELVCEQCDGADPREFCIVEGDPLDPAKVATCCNDGAECCGDQCCGDPQNPMRQCCNGQCVNLHNDPNNCGQCGKSCLGAACVGGLCECPPGTNLCAGLCANIYQDHAHCGECGRACPTDATCTGGVCICPSGTRWCEDGCVDTTSDRNNCGECGFECGADYQCCTSWCYNVLTDFNHCGRCDHACPSGYECCNGACTDTNTDYENCGDCGHVCDSGEMCCGGFCRTSSLFVCCPDGSRACPTPDFICCQNTSGAWDCC